MIRKLITTLRRTGAFIALASALVGASAAAATALSASRSSCRSPPRLPSPLSLLSFESSVRFAGTSTAHQK